MGHALINLAWNTRYIENTFFKNIIIFEYKEGNQSAERVPLSIYCPGAYCRNIVILLWLFSIAITHAHTHTHTHTSTSGGD